MNFLPNNNKLNERLKRESEQESDSDTFSPWTATSGDETDGEVVVPATERKPRGRRSSGDAQEQEALRSSLASMLPIRHPSPHRAAPPIERTARPTFQRLDTLRSQQSSSLLASALKQKGAWSAQGPGDEADQSSQATSSTEEFSDLGDVLTEDEGPRTWTPPSMPMPRPIPARTPLSTSAGSAGSPRRRRGVRPGTSPSNSLGRRRSGVESEPEEGSGKASDHFLELLDATKEFMSFSNATVSNRPFSASSPARTTAALPPVPPPSQAEVESSNSSNEIDVPTSFAASGILSDSQDEAPAKTPEKGPSSWFSWLAGLLEIKVWQALAVCSLAFSAGIGLGVG